MPGKRLVIYPADTARMIVGGSSPACNRAVECWAVVLRRSMPDLSRAEWNFIADILNGTFIADGAFSGHEYGAGALAAELADAQSLSGRGDRWLGDDADAAVANLVIHVKSMTWEQVQYIYTACLFFWGDNEIAPEDEWWTLPYRVQRLAARGAAAEA